MAFAHLAHNAHVLFGMSSPHHPVLTCPLLTTLCGQGVDEFAAAFRAAGYSSCWGDTPDPMSATTFNARTYLQPQLQKAAKSDEKVGNLPRSPYASLHIAVASPSHLRRISVASPP